MKYTRLVLSPHEPLVEGGAAEQFERQVQALLADGHRHLVVDLGGVVRIDDAGIRATRSPTQAPRWRCAEPATPSCGTASTTSFLDTEALPNGVKVTYFVIAEFDEGTRSGPSNFATITAVE